MSAVVHIAGQTITIGDNLMRQRCAWCGAVLCDYDLSRIAVPEGDDRIPATWPTGELVAVDGIASWAVLLDEGEKLPDGACALLDPAVTV